MNKFSLIKQHFDLILQKFLGPKYIRAGKCKQCGVCCRTITFKHNEKFITRVEDFDSLKNWQKRYNNFFISGKDKDGILLFTCKWLTKENKCKYHWLRSWFCRAYPFVKTEFIARGGQTLDDCGFYYTASKSFDDIVKSYKK